MTPATTAKIISSVRANSARSLKRAWAAQEMMAQSFRIGTGNARILTMALAPCWKIRLATGVLKMIVVALNGADHRRPGKERGVMCDRYRDGKCISRYCHYLSAGGTCLNPKMKPNPTNADRIRSTTDEELADWIDSMLNEDRDDWYPIGCYRCINFKTHHSDPNNKGTHLYACDGCDHEGSHENGLKYGVLKWLQQPAKEEA